MLLLSQKPKKQFSLFSFLFLKATKVLHSISMIAYKLLVAEGIFFSSKIWKTGKLSEVMLTIRHSCILDEHFEINIYISSISGYVSQLAS